jgi:hypothetical protein
VIGLKSEVSVHRRIAEIGKADWDACAAASDYAANPFVSFDFLDCLEQADCAVERTGWGPAHILLRDEAGAAAAVMPLYLKSHSRGEYVFDHAWAEAYQRAGGAYYPKLQGCSPFSPVTGPRLLVRPDIDREAGQKRLLAGALALCERAGASGVHVSFPTEQEWRLMGEEGLLRRQDQQYHWFNHGYATFDDFLAALSSGRRKTIRRERRDALAEVEVVALTGAELTEAHWDAFFGFYMDTGSRKWGRPYLTRRFFSLLSERMADRILPLDRRGAEPDRGGLPLRPALGLRGGRAVPALRALLLPGHRARHPPRPAPGGGRRPGAAQDRARLSADHGLFGPLHRRSGAARTCRPLSGAGTRGGAAGDGLAGRGVFPVPRGRRQLEWVEEKWEPVFRPQSAL